MGRQKVEVAKLKFMKIFKEVINSGFIRVLEQKGWVRTEIKVDMEKLFKAEVYKEWTSKLFFAKAKSSPFVEVILFPCWQPTKGVYRVEVMIYRKGEKPASFQFDILALNGQMPAEDDVAKLKVFLKACVDIASA